MRVLVFSTQPYDRRFLYEANAARPAAERFPIDCQEAAALREISETTLDNLACLLAGRRCPNAL
ncbi:hypothetical protein HKW98_07740 [Stutzerimonas urumqiensis]|uniref:hypothetical protein n=1 Tax=Stutzerimonas urumqiensis TaxID=638269 RepID=UPI003BAAD884